MSIQTEEIKIPAHDGGAFVAYVAMPETLPAPAVIMIQEIFGVNQEMREKCDEMARQGYIAICPDLFWRIEPGIQLVDSKEDELQRAFDLFGQFDVEKGMEDLKTTYGYIANHGDCTKTVGCLGYCLGGKLAFMMSLLTDIRASVSYYGVGLDELVEQKDKIDHPVMLHIAEEDEFVSKDAQEQIKAALDGNSFVTTHSYDGVNHAFARGQGMHYDAEAASLANQRTADFLSKHLNK